MRIILGLPIDRADQLSAEASRYGHEVLAITNNAQSLSAAVGELAPEIVVATASSVVLTDAVLATCDSRGVRVIAVVASDAERRHAASLGIFETADAADDWAAYETLVSGPTLALGDPLSATSGARGTVLAVWGPAGSPGRTSTAIGIAVELATAGYAVALGDVDTHAASIAPALGLLDEAPGFAAACRLSGADALNRSELERIGQRYEAGLHGFWVLTGIGRASRWPELSADRVRGTIDECRRWVDFTVLDTSSSLENDEEISTDLFAPRRNAGTLTALREADRVVAVGAADPIGLSRFLRAHVELLDLIEPDRVDVVINKVRSSAIGLNPAGQVAQTLSRFGGIDPAALVPFDLSGYDSAVLSGRTLAEVAGKSPARHAIAQYVRTRLLGMRSLQPASGRRKARL